MVKSTPLKGKRDVSEKGYQFDDRLLRVINAYLEENRDPGTPVTLRESPERLKAALDLSLDGAGCSLEDLYGHIDGYLRHAVRTGHPQFFNQLWSGFTVPGFLGEVIAALTNGSMYTYEMSPVATLMEREIVARMGRLAGFDSPEGLMVTGGSSGNLQAMMLARHRAMPDVKRRGFFRPLNPVAFVSEEAHYSFEKAANVLGIGMDQVIKVQTDEAGRMRPQDLERKIQASRESGGMPFFVGATAGTTVKGAFDPLSRIAPIAQRHGLWFHVDGSLGGSVLLSPRHRTLLEGLEQSDSFIWNPHKLMGLPVICSVFLVKKAGRLLKTNSVAGADYIFHDEGYGEHDIGPMSLQCGRRVDALKLWLSWKYYGDRGYAERLDRFFTLAEYAEAVVAKTSGLELMAPRSSVTVCFRARPPRGVDPNGFNIELREWLASRGKGLINYAHLGEDVVLRLVVANHAISRRDIDRFFHSLMIAAKSLKGSRKARGRASTGPGDPEP
jgi:glutamate/tyrosine decarboxylase-like PLP-dependent enzyme